MKKKLSKIAALMLAAVMVISGLVIVPREAANAAGKPSFTVEVNATQVKPGDTVTATLWLDAGSDLTSFAGIFEYDPNVYEISPNGVKRGEIFNDAFASAIDRPGSSGVTPGELAVFIDNDTLRYTERISIATFTMKVKADASGSGRIGFNFGDGTQMDDQGNEITLGNGNAISTVEDTNGNVITGGEIPVFIELNSITINKDDFTMEKGSTDTLTVTGSPEAAMEGKVVRWTSSDDSVVSVDQNGNVTAKGIGTVAITATVDDKTDSVNITVNAPLKGIKLNKTELTLKKGTSETLVVTYDPEDTTDDKTVTWTSSDESVASVDSNGKVTAHKDGQATITAKVGNYTAECKVNVQEVKLTGISLDKESVEVNKGESAEKLTVKYEPENTTDDKTVTWTSSDESVAVVEDGVITGIGAGTATITAKVGAFTDTCEVKVVSKLQSITITPDKAVDRLEAGDTVKMTVGYNPADTTDSKAVTWESMDENVATVDENGVVTAVGGGVTKIVAVSAADSSIKAECEIKVLIHTEGIKLNTTNIELLKGETTEPLTVTFIPANTDDSKEVKWSSSDESVATVDAEGRITGLKEGTAIITAETVVGGFTASCEVNVKEIHVNDAELSDELNPSVLYVGQKHTLKVTIDPENTTDDVYYTYSSSDSEIASVSGEGVVSALKEGKAEITITVIAGDFTKELVYKVEVKEIPLESIAFKEKVTPLEVGKTAQLEIIFNPENTTVDKTVEWSSSNTDVASISENGLVSALKAGTATITAKAGGKEVSYELTVIEKKVDKPGTTPPTDNKDQNNDNKTNNGGAVQTGDTGNFFGIMLAMLVSLSVVAAAIVFKGRGKRMHK